MKVLFLNDTRKIKCTRDECFCLISLFLVSNIYYIDGLAFGSISLSENNTKSHIHRFCIRLYGIAM